MRSHLKIHRDVVKFKNGPFAQKKTIQLQCFFFPAPPAPLRFSKRAPVAPVVFLKGAPVGSRDFVGRCFFFVSTSDSEKKFFRRSGVVLEAVETHRLCQNTVCEAQTGRKNVDFAKGTFTGEKSCFGRISANFGRPAGISFLRHPFGPFELCAKSQKFLWLQIEVLPFLRSKKKHLRLGLWSTGLRVSEVKDFNTGFF